MKYKYYILVFSNKIIREYVVVSCFVINRPFVCSRFPEDGGFCNHGSNNIRIHVRSWSPILKIPFSFLLCVTSNTNRRAAVSNSLQKHHYCRNIVSRIYKSSSSSSSKKHFITHKNVLMSAVSCLPVSRRSFPSP